MKIPMQRWFVLEDEHERRDFFVASGVPRANIFRHPVDLVDAIAATTGEVVVFLDHDLGLREFVPYPREINGMDAVVALNAMQRRGVYIIHSMNDPASRTMASSLLVGGAIIFRRPFTAIRSDMQGIIAKYGGE